MKNITLALIAGLVASTAGAGQARDIQIRGVAVQSGDTVVATIAPAGDLDTFVFTACEGTRLRVALRAAPGSHLRPSVTLTAAASGPESPTAVAIARHRRTRLKKLVLPATGEYALRVGGADGTSGSYRLKLRLRPPRKRTFRDVPLAPGSSADFRVGACAGASVKATVRGAGGSFTVESVYETSGGEVPGGVAAFGYDGDGSRAHARLPAASGAGDLGIVLRAGDGEPVLLDVTLKLTYPKTTRRHVSITAPEPSVASVAPPVALPGELVSVLGTGFAAPAPGEGLPEVLFGDTPGDAPEFVNDGRIDVTVPLGDGSVDVTVFNPDGQDGVRAAAFTFATPTPPEPEPEPEPDPLDEGLVAHWSFDEGAGDMVLDRSGSGNAGRVSGAAEWALGALRFDGSDDGVTVPDELAAPDSSIGDLAYGSISLWFRYDDVRNDDVSVEVLPLLYFGRSPQEAVIQHFDLLAIYIGHGNASDPGDRQIYFTVADSDRITLCFDSGAITLQQSAWYHYVVVIAPDGHRAYLNGAEFERDYNAGTDESSHGFFDTVALNQTLRVGHGRHGISGTWWRWNGLIGDVRIYDRTLSADEVRALYLQR